MLERVEIERGRGEGVRERGGVDLAGEKNLPSSYKSQHTGTLRVHSSSCDW